MAFCRHGRGYPASLPAEVIGAALHSCTLPKFIFLLFKGASSGLQRPHLEEWLCHQSCAWSVFFFTLFTLNCRERSDSPAQPHGRVEGAWWLPVPTAAGSLTPQWQPPPLTSSLRAKPGTLPPALPDQQRRQCCGPGSSEIRLWLGGKVTTHCILYILYTFLPTSGDGCLAEVPLRLLSNVTCPALGRDNLWISSLAAPGLFGLCSALGLLLCPLISWDVEQGWCTASSLSLLFPSKAALDAGGRTPPPPPPPLLSRSVVGLCPSQPTEQNVLVSISPRGL